MRLTCFMLVVALSPVYASVDERGTFAHYQIIVDRMPFGDLSKAEETPADPNRPPLSAILRLVALEKNDKTGIVQAGIIDSSTKKNHYLTVGEEADGVKLVEVNYQEDRALVRKGEQEEWLTMRESGEKSKTSTVPAGIEARRAVFERNRELRRIAMPGTPPPAPKPTPNADANDESDEDEEETDE